MYALLKNTCLIIFAFYTLSFRLLKSELIPAVTIIYRFHRTDLFLPQYPTPSCQNFILARHCPRNFVSCPACKVISPDRVRVFLLEVKYPRVFTGQSCARKFCMAGAYCVGEPDSQTTPCTAVSRMLRCKTRPPRTAAQTCDEWSRHNPESSCMMPSKSVFNCQDFSLLLIPSILLIR